MCILILILTIVPTYTYIHTYWSILYTYTYIHTHSPMYYFQNLLTMLIFLIGTVLYPDVYMYSYVYYKFYTHTYKYVYIYIYIHILYP